jgi:hypothetical protein
MAMATNGIRIGTRKNPRASPVNTAMAAQAPAMSRPTIACRGGSCRLSRQPNANSAATTVASNAGLSEARPLTTANTTVGMAATISPEVPPARSSSIFAVLDHVSPRSGAGGVGTSGSGNWFALLSVIPRWLHSEQSQSYLY